MLLTVLELFRCLYDPKCTAWQCRFQNHPSTRSRINWKLFCSCDLSIV